jgi:hypothetical protein
MKVLIACEFSGIIARGHDALSVDLLPSERPGPHMIRDLTKLPPSWFRMFGLLLAFPPCTFLTNAGVRHLSSKVKTRRGGRAKIYGKARFAEMEKAVAFFNFLLHAPIPRICVENPIPHRYARALIGYYDQIIEPKNFGESEVRRTACGFAACRRCCRPSCFRGASLPGCICIRTARIARRTAADFYQGLPKQWQNSGVTHESRFN